MDRDPNECPHENVSHTSTGTGFRMTPSGVDCDLEQHSICLDCGAEDEELLYGNDDDTPPEALPL